MIKESDFSAASNPQNVPNRNRWTFSELLNDDAVDDAFGRNCDENNELENVAEIDELEQDDEKSVSLLHFDSKFFGQKGRRKI